VRRIEPGLHADRHGACAAAEQERPMTSAAPLHFLDLIDIPKDELRRIIETSRA